MAENLKASELQTARQHIIAAQTILKRAKPTFTKRISGLPYVAYLELQGMDQLIDRLDLVSEALRNGYRKRG